MKTRRQALRSLAVAAAVPAAAQKHQHADSSDYLVREMKAGRL